MLTDWFYKRLYQCAGWVALLVLGCLAYLFGNIEIKDLDLWLHLASGRYILEHFSLPHIDILSHTMAGQPWNNHEWLFQIIIAQVYHLFGAEGWISLRLVVFFLICFHLFFIGYDNERPFWPVVLLILTVFVFSQRLLLRPELFSLLFFVMFIHILGTQLDKKKALYSLFFLQILWVNMHGFFIFGVLLVGIYVGSEYIKRYMPLPYQWKTVGRLTDFEFKNLKMIFFSLCVACFINPNFIEGAIYPLKVLFSIGADTSIFFDQIAELQKPITWTTLFSWQPYPIFRWLIIIPAVSFILNRRHLDVGVLALWVIFLCLSLAAFRNMVFYALVAYFVSLINLMHLKWDEALPIKIKSVRLVHMTAFCILVGFSVWIFRIGDQYMIRGYFDYDRMERKSERGGISQRNFSHKAVNFMKQNQVQGNLLNDFNSGAYLLGRMHPDIRVFIDGRTEVYGSDFFKQYKKIWKGDKKLLDQAIAQYNITGAFLNTIYVAPPEKLIQYFDQQEEWHLVYFDHDAVIYLKDTPEQKNIIQQHEIQLENWKAPALDPYALGAKKLDPYRQVLRAEALIHLKKFEQARKELNDAHIISPKKSDVYNLLGKILLEEGEYQDAYIYFRKALAVDMHNDKARFNFAKALYYLGYPDKSKEQLVRVLNKHSDFYPAVFYFGVTEAETKTFKEAQSIFTKSAALAGDGFFEFLEEQPIAASLKERIKTSLK